MLKVLYLREEGVYPSTQEKQTNKQQQNTSQPENCYHIFQMKTDHSLQGSNPYPSVTGLLGRNALALAN